MVVKGSFVSATQRQVVLLFGFAVLLQLQSSAILAVSAFAVALSSKSSVSYGSAFDSNPNNGVRIFATGVDVLTQPSQSQFQWQCFVSVTTTRATGYDSSNFHPTLCLDIYMSSSHWSNGTGKSPSGLVTAMKDAQPLLYKFRYDHGQPILENTPLELPPENVPVLFTADSESSNIDEKNQHKDHVYVALHPTNVITPSYFSSDTINDTIQVSPRSMQDYFQHFKHPRYTTLNSIGDMGYSPTVAKYNLETYQEEWKLVFNTTKGKTLIAGMAIVHSTHRLVVFGSTTGYGMTVGAGAKPNGTNWMGFMTWVDLDSGNIDLSNYRSETHNSHGTPIRSQRNQDDMVLGICLEPGDDKAYVLGSTTGKFEGTQNWGGFVWKLDTDRFDPTWKRQFVGEGVEFTKCAIQSDIVVVGGHVPPRTSLAPINGNAETSNSKTWDIVVAALDVSSGATLWIRQIDSHWNDQLVSLQNNPNDGGVYLTANAWDENSDSVVLYSLSMDLEGNHDWYQISPTVDPLTGIDSKGPPPVNDNERPSDNGSIQSTSSSSGTNDNGSSDMETAAQNNTTVILVSTIVPLVLVFGIAIAIATYQNRTTNTTNPSALAAANTDEARQEEPASASTNTYEGDFDDVESVASENKLL